MVEAERIRLLLFVSSHCPHCPKAERVVHRIAPEYYEGGLSYKKVRINTGEGKDLSSRYGVRGTPTILFVDGGGVEKGRIVGAPSENKLRGSIEGLLGVKKSFFGRLFGGRDGS